MLSICLFSARAYAAHAFNEDTLIECHCAAGTVPGIGFIVGNQTDVVPTLKVLKVGMGRQACKRIV